MESEEILKDFRRALVGLATPLLDTSQIWISPKRAGALPATASIVPLELKARDSMRGDSPTSRAIRFEPSGLRSRTS